ncbi:MAG: 2,3-bisphosphoglycerate-dependent phosphoglycerate mutase [Nitrosarchaeum sp.]|nr:2,3-bisphosphoglycerate-dependent phosphoglycerate mutase [Nitrosarchaeum sp.]
MGYLILVRHGESRWNIDNKFTGWTDVPLSEVGIHEALIAAKELEGLQFDVAFTSELTRAQETLLLILAKQDACGIFLHEKGPRKDWFLHPGKIEEHEIPVYTHWRLNERYYGKLQGVNKDQARKRYGEEQVFIWRRSYDIKPPGGESLKDVVKRTVPYFEKTILPQIKKGKNVLIAAHGNSLRAIVKHIEGIADQEIPQLELATGKPLIYSYKHGKLRKEGKIHAFTRPLHWTHKRPTFI